jgi:hypothetical protein
VRVKMGLLSAPWRGLLWIFEEFAERAEEERNDPGAVTAELERLYQQLEAGALDEREFARLEAELEGRLVEILERRSRRAAGVS